MPVAVTANVAIWPVLTVRLTGCAVMAGACEPVNVTRNTDPVPRARYHRLPSAATRRSTGLAMPVAKPDTALPLTVSSLRIQPLQKSAKK